MNSILRQVQRRVGSWIGSSAIHLGDHNVPNALMFIGTWRAQRSSPDPVAPSPAACEGKFDAAHCGGMGADRVILVSLASARALGLLLPLAMMSSCTPTCLPIVFAMHESMQSRRLSSRPSYVAITNGVLSVRLHTIRQVHSGVAHLEPRRAGY